MDDLPIAPFLRESPVADPNALTSAAPELPVAPWLRGKPSDQPREAIGAIEAIQAGFQSSVRGLEWRGKLPDLIVNPQHSKWWERALSSATQVVSELPEMTLGAIGGGAAGTAAGALAGPAGAVAGGVMGSGAGMMAVPAAIRQSLMEAYKDGGLKTTGDYFTALQNVAKATLEQGAIGAVTMGAGSVAARTVGKAVAPIIGSAVSPGVAMAGINTADTLAQISAMTMVPAALQGQMPNAQDFVDAAIVIGGMHVANIGAGKLMDIYAKTGRTPAQVVADVRQDPTIAEDLAKANPINEPGDGHGMQRQTPTEEIGKTISTRLEALGASPEEAQAKGALFESFFNSRHGKAAAESMGITPRELFDRYYGGITNAEEMPGKEHPGYEQPFAGPEIAKTPLAPETKTLNINGVERPAVDSAGKPIHWSEEGVRNFWNSFEGSKVVDGEGRPLEVYHGTGEKFDTFQKSDGGSLGDGVYLTKSKPAGQEYADTAQGSPNLMNLYVVIKNPASEAIASEFESRYGGRTSRELQKAGYDGVVAGDEIVAFNPEQIKSAVGNTGAFDPNNPNILKQSAPEDQVRMLAKKLDTTDADAKTWYQNGYRIDPATKDFLRTAKGDILYQGGPATFFSALARHIDESATKAAQAEGWKAQIKGAIAKGTVKAAEVEATGLNDWLDMQQGKVTKEQVQAFLDQNGVQVKDVTLGGEGSSLKPLTAELVDSGDKEFEIPSTWKVLTADGYSEKEFYAESAQDAIDKARASDWYAELPDHEAVNHPSAPKFASYQLPGGENYKELLLTLPKSEADASQQARLDELIKQRADLGSEALLAKTPEARAEAERQARNATTQIKMIEASIEKAGTVFRSAHFDQPNILSHVRFNERRDSEGNKVLFLEELQSDWAQKGRKDGFKANVTEAQKQEWLAERNAVLEEDGLKPFKSYEDAARILGGMEEDGITVPGTIPSAPFVGKTEAWTALALKRMIRYAAENGFDRVAWTNGEQQAARYDLSKQIYHVAYQSPDSQGKYHVEAVAISGDRLMGATYTLSEIEDNLGKEIAQKIERGEGEDSGYGIKNLKGLDLKVGGEGMKGYYDKIVPSVANDILKKLGGGKVEEIELPGKPEFGIKPDGKTGDIQTSTKQAGFDITDKMRENAMAGQPLFQRGRTVGEKYLKDGSVALDALAREGNDKAILAKSLVDSSRLDAQELSDVLVRVSELSESDRLSKSPSLVGMLSEMRGAILDDPKVLDSVVRSVPVDMVDNLFGSEAAAKVALHDQAMLKDSTAFNADLPISESIDAARSVGLLVREAAIEAAKTSRVAFGAGLESGENASALIAGEGNGFSHNGSPRAYLEFVPGGKMSIGLLATADRSSFLHESGHFFLEVMTDLAKMPDAPKDLVADMDAVYNWMGVKDASTWADMTLEQRRPYHEQWARGFESYLMDGKAPTPRLAAAFMRFRDWLIEVYKSAATLNVQLSDDVRGVMDRMLTSQEEHPAEPPQALIGKGVSPPLAEPEKAPAAGSDHIDQILASGEPNLAAARTIEHPMIRETLQTMAEKESEWSEIGGRLLRIPDPEDASREIVSRTLRIPKEEWWAERPGPSRLNEKQTLEAVRKAIAGEHLNLSETRTIEFMVKVANDRLDAVHQLGAEEFGNTMADVHKAGLPPTTENVFDSQAVARAMEINAQAFAEAAARYDAHNDDALFMGEIRSIINERVQDTQANASRQAAAQPSQSGGADAANQAQPGAAGKPAILKQSGAPGGDAADTARVGLDKALDDAAAEEVRQGIPRAYAQAAATEKARLIVPGDKARDAAENPFAEALPQAKGEPALPTHVNYNYINTTEDVKLAMATLSDVYESEIQTQRRGTVGWEQTSAEAAKILRDNLGGQAGGLITPRNPGTAAGAAEILARKQLTLGSAEEMLKARDSLLEKGSNASAEDKLQFLAAIERSAMIQAEFLGARAEAGRALNILKSTARDAERMKLIQQVIEKFGGGDPIEIAKILKEVDTPSGALKFAREAKDATTWEKIVEAWKAGILSGPVTHMANLVGNGAFAVMRPPLDVVASLVGKISGQNIAERVSAMEGPARLLGLLQGTQDGLKLALASIRAEEWDGKSEQYAPAIRGKLGGTSAWDKTQNVAGPIIRMPFRALTAADQLFKTMNERGEAYAEAAHMATVEGLNPLSHEFRERVVELVQNPSNEMQDKITNAGLRFTFNVPLGEKGRSVQNFVKAWHLEWVVPFIRTPANIAQELLRMTPFAPFIHSWMADIKTGGAVRDKAIAEIMLGTATMGAVMTYAFAGNISGAGGPDRGKKNMAQAAGWQPYSLKIEDTWYSYGRIQPIGTLMGLAADTAEIWDHMTEEEADKIPKMISIAFANAITNQTFLQGIATVTNLMSDPTRFGPRFIQSMAGSTVPNIVGQTTSMNDPLAREIDSSLDAIKARIPGYRQELFPKRDPWGQPQDNKDYVGGVLPITRKKESTDKVATEAARLDVSAPDLPKKIHIGKNTGKIGDIKITPEQRDAFGKVSGELVHSMMEPLVNSLAWDSLPDLVKKRAYVKAFSLGHRAGAMAALPPDARAGVIQEITQKMTQELSLVPD